MARHNRVADRVILEATCTAEILLAARPTGRLLVVCDCDGYETELFTPEVARHLENHDLLIETHDFLSVDISTKIKAAFEKTHDIDSIFSTDDIAKVRNYHYEELDQIPLTQRFGLLAERRPTTQEWLILTSRTH